MELRDAVHRLAAKGGDFTTVRRGLDDLLRAAVRHDLAAISTIDPSTTLWTSCFVSGVPLEGAREREQIIFDIEFHEDDVNAYREIAARDVPVARLHAATGGNLAAAKRFGPLLEPLGVSDEMRVMLCTDGMCWGSLTLYRTVPHPPFSETDERTVARAVTAMAHLFRLSLLRAALDAPGAIADPPGLVLVGPDGSVKAASAHAQAWLDAIDDRGRTPSALSALCSAVRSGDGLARSALPGRDGRWVVLHGSSVTDEEGTVAVIIEGARPAELAEVIAGAYRFTPREREVTSLVAQGRSTKQIASALGLSPFTVSDHLRSVFAKVGVQSRGELVAALYARHYEPQAERGVMPGPYGWYLDDAVRIESEPHRSANLASTTTSAAG
jgi:DNA-binding CsgD family transcriptional regulator